MQSVGLEVIGEASRNLPDELINSSPEIEWKTIVALRNILAHEYFQLTDSIIWDIIKNKLPALQKCCSRLALMEDKEG